MRSTCWDKYMMSLKHNVKLSLIRGQITVKVKNDKIKGTIINFRQCANLAGFKTEIHKKYIVIFVDNEADRKYYF